MCLPLCYCASKIWKKKVVVVLCMLKMRAFSAQAQSQQIEQTSGRSSSVAPILEQLYRKSASAWPELIPFIHHQEVTKVKNDIKGKCVSVIFDGTTHVCEAMVIVLLMITGIYSSVLCG